MSENLYDKVNFNKVPECKKPLVGTELHEHQYIKLQQPQGVYDIVRVAEQKVSCQQKCY